MKLLHLPLLLLLGLAAPAAADDQAAANRLFVEAATKWNEAAELSGNEIATLKRRVALLETVDANLSAIVADHAGSDLAVRLVIGEQIGAVSIAMARSTLSEARAALEREECWRSPDRACIFGLALETARDVEDGSFRALMLSGIVRDQAEAGLFADAIKTARSIDEAYRRASALAGIAKAQAEAGLIEEALETARGIDRAYRRALALAGIAKAHPQPGLIEEALETARGIDDLAYRAIAMADIVPLQPEAGLIEEALDTARNIGKRFERARALARIATMMPE